MPQCLGLTGENPPVTAKQVKFEHHLTIKHPEQSDAVSLLATLCSLSKQQVKQAMVKGAVWLTRGKTTTRLRRTKRALQLGDELHIYYNSSVLQQQVDDAVLISDQQQFSVWYKPYAMLCQGSKWSDHTTINRYAELNLSPQRTANIIHRLDRAATGLVVIGHAKQATAAIAKQFELRHTDKIYQVIVEGQFPSQPITINSDVDGKSACSHARVLAYDSNQHRSLVEVKIDTGRKHQIRIHMASSGYPVVGDRQHGDATGDDDNLQLTACFLAFNSPVTGERLEFSLPQQYRPTLSALRS
ncbi:RluA family pseudouridine synthase [Shewanella waksmanii]|uniref:RluA family pseudouridine synthase n=1 Tax=Shewanella waksmanii TaxID=213783 RepID=UPI003735CE31